MRFLPIVYREQVGARFILIEFEGSAFAHLRHGAPIAFLSVKVPANGRDFLFIRDPDPSEGLIKRWIAWTSTPERKTAWTPLP